MVFVSYIDCHNKIMLIIGPLLCTKKMVAFYNEYKSLKTLPSKTVRKLRLKCTRIDIIPYETT